MTNITLRCEKCARSMDYPRSVDPGIPPRVVTIATSQCDECHDGDRMSERWLDADGNEPDPLGHQPSL